MKTLYYGGPILTLEDPLYVEALLIENGRIQRWGSREELLPLLSAKDKQVDLEGAALLPAFMDSHSHITALASTLGACPLAGSKSFSEIYDRLQKYRDGLPSTAPEWIIGFGYDQNILAEGQHPTRELLDQVSCERPIIISHASGHMGTLNTAALRLLGITSSTPDPSGGKIGREPDGITPNGYLEETAFTITSSKIPQPTQKQLLDQLLRAQDIYLSHGITTVQDGYTKAGDWELLRLAAEKNLWKADIVCYAGMRENPELLARNPDYLQYQNRMRWGGYKIFLDGSPQGRTAWMSSPYENDPQGYCGYGTYPDADVEHYFYQALQEGRQLLAHCNGDAAAAQMIAAYANARKKLPDAPDIRPVMIHAQLLRPDQLPAMAQLHMMASFFVAHTYHWGDTHIQNFGQRAAHISPAASARRKGVCFTFHQDSPVLPPDMLETVGCAVLRRTRSGVLLGQDECLSPLDALHAITRNVAYQYHEEDQKGTLLPGKLADLVILDHDPLRIPAERIASIRVLETIKEGQTVFCRTQ